MELITKIAICVKIVFSMRKRELIFIGQNKIDWPVDNLLKNIIIIIYHYII